MIKPIIVYTYEDAHVSGQKIKRPLTMGAQQWIEFWEAVVDFEDPAREIERLEKELEDANAIILELQDRIEDLTDQLGEK